MGILSWFGLGKKEETIQSAPAKKKPSKEWLQVTARFKKAEEIAWGNDSFYPIDDLGGPLHGSTLTIARREIKKILPTAKHELLEWEALATEISGKVKASIKDKIIAPLKKLYYHYEYFQHNIKNEGMGTIRKVRGKAKITNVHTTDMKELKKRLSEAQDIYKNYRNLVRKQYLRRKNKS